MKAAVSLPMTILIGIVLAILLIVFAIFMLGGLPGLKSEQTLRGYFESCCIAYSIAGHCEPGEEDLNFQCSIDPKIVAGGKISIAELAQKVGLSVDVCCKRE